MVYSGEKQSNRENWSVPIIHIPYHCMQDVRDSMLHALHHAHNHPQAIVSDQSRTDRSFLFFFFTGKSVSGYQDIFLYVEFLLKKESTKRHDPSPSTRLRSTLANCNCNYNYNNGIRTPRLSNNKAIQGSNQAHKQWLKM